LNSRLNLKEETPNHTSFLTAMGTK